MRQQDEALIIASCSGDSSAFGEIVRRYQNYVASIAYSATGSFDQSEEIAQQTFVAAWEGRQKLKDPSSLVAWLGGITRNLIRTNFRKEARYVATNELGNVVDRSSDPLQRCINQEQQEMLWSVLERLPEIYREPLILYHRNGRSTAEVARLLGLSPDAVKQRLSRGRKLIREELSAFVEKSLAQSGPNSQFSTVVLALIAGNSKAALATGSAVGAGGAAVTPLAKTATVAAKPVTFGTWKIAGSIAASVALMVALIVCSAVVGMNWLQQQFEVERVEPHAFQLDNGLNVVLRQVEGTMDAALVTVFDVGELHDPAGKSGLAHLVEHLYVTSATDKMPARNVQQYLAAYPKGWNAQTGGDYTVIATVFESKKLRSEIQDAAARMNALDIQQADLDREIPRMTQEVDNMFVNFAPLVVNNLAAENLRPRPHSGRKGGHPDQIKKLTLSDAQSHWKSFYKPANATIVLAGKFDLEKTEQWIRKAFGDIGSGEQPVRGTAKPLVTERSEFDVANNEEIIVCNAISYPKPGSDLYPAAVAIASTLIQKGRLSANNAQQSPALFMPLDDFGVIYLRGWGEQKQDGSMESVDEIEARLEAMVSDLDPAEVVKSAALAKTQLAFFLDTKPLPDSVMKNNIYGIAFGIARRGQLGINGPDLAQRLDNLTVEQVSECLEKYFVKDKRAVAVVK